MFFTSSLSGENRPVERSQHRRRSDLHIADEVGDYEIGKLQINICVWKIRNTFYLGAKTGVQVYQLCRHCHLSRTQQTLLEMDIT